MENLLLLEQAAKAAIANSEAKPKPDRVVEALLQAEKNTKQTKVSYSLPQLIGTWRLCFITGTKKTRQRAGIVLGAGRYLPSFAIAKLNYSLDERSTDNETGKVENSVNLGALKLSLTGPIKFLAKKNILVFDFTYISVQLFGIKLYQGYLPNGKTTEANFDRQKVNKQAFFTYFLVSDRLIATRGRGGGLALWTRD
jgi:hypothetical protein